MTAVTVHSDFGVQENMFEYTYSYAYTNTTPFYKGISVSLGVLEPNQGTTVLSR